MALLAVPPTGMSLGLVFQPQRGQRESREAEAEFLQRTAARDRLGHCFGQFIEFVVHNIPFVLFVVRFVSVGFAGSICLESEELLWAKDLVGTSELAPTARRCAIVETCVKISRVAIAAVIRLFALATEQGLCGIRSIWESQRGQRESGEAEAEFLRRTAARDGLGH